MVKICLKYCELGRDHRPSALIGGQESQAKGLRGNVFEAIRRVLRTQCFQIGNRKFRRLCVFFTASQINGAWTRTSAMGDTMLDTKNSATPKSRSIAIVATADITGAEGGVIFVRQEQPVPFLKRAFDKVFAVACLVFLSPVMFMIALAIRLSGEGPVLFAHSRVGHGGRSFDCLKFRTMRQDSEGELENLLRIDPIAREEWLEQRKLERDPRVDRLGYFLRSTSLDELPQLFNVLRGEMSIVGPRPITRPEIEKYGQNYSDYTTVRPGLTGIWQVSGRSDTSYERRVALDVSYIRSWSMFQDIRIVMRTFSVVLLGRGAY